MWTEGGEMKFTLGLKASCSVEQRRGADINDQHKSSASGVMMEQWSRERQSLSVAGICNCNQSTE